MFPFPAGVLAQAAAAGLRPQDVFATTLFTGTGAVQTVTSGINLTNGGTNWEKGRSSSGDHYLTSALRGVPKSTSTDTTAAEAALGDSALSTTGFTTQWGSGTTVVAWSFKKAAKFYTEVVYTGDGTSGRQIAHDLGIAPGMIVIKRLNAAGDNWPVYNVGIGANQHLLLNSTGAAVNGSSLWQATAPTDSVFTVSNAALINASGSTYLARLWAHDPDTTNGIIQCGSYTTDAAATATVNLGWRPQFLIIKATSTAYGWNITDSARTGNGSSGAGNALFANTASAETANGGMVLTANGFSDPGTVDSNVGFVYLAIRSPV